MLLSVIVPTYNSEKTIEKCLSSIRNQIYSDLEIIVIDDGSIDGTVSIVKNISLSDSRIVLIEQENCGASLARKKGIDIAKGTFVGFVDSDDWIEPQMYSDMIYRATINKADVVCCNMSYDYKKKQIVHYQKVNGIVDGNTALFLLNNRVSVYASLANKIIKKELFNSIIFPQKGLIGEDYTIVRQILLNSNNICILNKDYYHYIQHDGSTCRKGYTIEQKRAFYNYMRIIKETYYSRNKELIYSTDNYIINEFLWIVISMYKNKQYDMYIVRKIKKFVSRRVGMVINNKYNSFLYKSSVIMLFINFKFLGLLYELYNIINSFYYEDNK